jgi:rod shape-determining protein MreD
MRWLRFLMPVASVAALTIVAILPWGLPTEDRFVLPLLPVVAIYYWTLDRDAWLPEWSVFLAGLLLDVLTQGPLGYWALVYLIAYTVAAYCSGLRTETTAERLAVFAAAIVAVTVFAWLAASAYFIAFLDGEPYARGAGVAVVAASLMMLFVRLFRSAGTPARPVRLTRGD